MHVVLLDSLHPICIQGSITGVNQFVQHVDFLENCKVVVMAVEPVIKVLVMWVSAEFGVQDTRIPQGWT